MAQGRPIWVLILTVLQGDLGQIPRFSQGINTKRVRLQGQEGPVYFQKPMILEQPPAGASGRGISPSRLATAPQGSSPPTPPS